MPPKFENVCSSEKTGSERSRVKMMRLTDLRHWPGHSQYTGGHRERLSLPIFSHLFDRQAILSVGSTQGGGHVATHKNCQQAS
jgi:hypothetical protein